LIQGEFRDDGEYIEDEKINRTAFPLLLEELKELSRLIFWKGKLLKKEYRYYKNNYD
jgi:hypothetical protein